MSETLCQGPTAGPFWLRCDAHGHTAAIERDGYTVLHLQIGTVRNEEEASGIVELLNKAVMK